LPDAQAPARDTFRLAVTALHNSPASLILARGRDPYFPGWPDTLQRDYANSATQGAMIGELLRIGAQCDGVRCDMAMLVLPDVFERTWGLRCQPYWTGATRRVRDKFPNFCFVAEVYSDLEWTLQQQGFDYTYDKRVCDRLRDRDARPVREHFLASLVYQRKMARFLENHHEPRAAATFSPDVHQSAAVSTFLSPGLRFFHQDCASFTRDNLKAAKSASRHIWFVAQRSPSSCTGTIL